MGFPLTLHPADGVGNVARRAWQHSLRSFAGPAVLLGAVCIVDGGALAYLIATDGQSSHTWRAVGDLDAAAALGVLGALFFPAATIAACRLEGDRLPRIRDHFRHCAFLYAAAAVFLAYVWPNRESTGGSLGFAMMMVLAAGAAVGIAANAVTLVVRRLAESTESPSVTTTTRPG